MNDFTQNPAFKELEKEATSLFNDLGLEPHFGHYQAGSMCYLTVTFRTKGNKKNIEHFLNSGWEIEGRYKVADYENKYTGYAMATKLQKSKKAVQQEENLSDYKKVVAEIGGRQITLNPESSTLINPLEIFEKYESPTVEIPESIHELFSKR